MQAAQPLSVGALLLAVCSRDLQVVQAGVELLLEVLQPKPHPFLALEDDDEVMRSLYFTLQNQALKVGPALCHAACVLRTPRDSFFTCYPLPRFGDRRQ